MKNVEDSESTAGVSRQEKRSWFPILVTIGAAFLAVGLTILTVPKWAGWFNLLAGLIFIFWGLAWGVRPKRDDHND